MYYILFYEVVEDYIERRVPFRDVHLNHVQQAYNKGHLIMAGAFDLPADGAALIFKVDTIEIIQSFAQTDPYVLHGVVTHWTIRSWNVVVGAVNC